MLLLISFDSSPGDDSSRDPASLLTLPLELHEIIFDNLTIFDKHALRGVCNYFRTLLPPFITLNPPVTLEKLYEAAYTWDHTRFKLQLEDLVKSRYVCTHCMRLLPRSRFSDDAFCLHTRDLFCIRCGVLPRKDEPSPAFGNRISHLPYYQRAKRKELAPYIPGIHISIEGSPHVLCVSCKKLQACSKWHKGPVCGVCRDHYENDSSSASSRSTAIQTY